MLRTWFACGLASTLLYTACGAGEESGLFGDVKPGGGRGGTATSIDPSLGSDGGSSEEPAPTTGGRAATGGALGAGGEREPEPTPGGQDPGGGGVPASGGVSADPSAGSDDPGAAGENAGGTATGSGGNDSGGAGGSDSGGSNTGGSETGGTTGGSETGGNGTGGSTGGTTGGSGTGGSTGGTTGGTTGGSETGGRGQGGAACRSAREQLEKLLIEAQSCDPDQRGACKSRVANECACEDVPVGDPLSEAIELYLQQLERVRKVCGTLDCVTFVCNEVSARCAPLDDGGGQCVSAGNTPTPRPRPTK